jgi:hypothetical protein
MRPSGVHTGEVKGCRLRAQNVYGRRWKDVWAPLDFWLTPEPADAEYASDEAHSECVICDGESEGVGGDEHSLDNVHKVCQFLWDLVSNENICL